MATVPQVVIYNDASSGEQDATIDAMLAALQQQVSQDFAPIWHADAALSFVPSSQKPPAGSWVISVLGNSDQAGALGYHDLTPDGLPLGKVFAATDRQYGGSLSVTISHELLEMLADPWICLAAFAADGKFYSWEVADACEADNLGYEISGVLVSDFVTPAWFGHGPGAVDFKQHLTAPFQVGAGGYTGVFDPANGQGWTQVTGQLHLLSAQERAAALPRIGSRRERRFRQRALWTPSTYETA